MPNWILLALAAGGFGGVAAYVRRTGHLGGVGLLVAAAAHGALLLLPVELPSSPAPQSPIEFQVATTPAPAPDLAPEPEPEPEPEPALEPQPPKAQTPKPKPKRRPKRSRPKPQKRPPSPEPAGSPAPLRFDLTATTTNSQSGVVVTTGTPTRPAGALSKAGGTGNGRGTGTGNGTGPAAVEATTGGKDKSWNPGSAASLASLPMPLNVPEIVCPATASQGVTGTVKLRVQVRANGRVRKVRVVKRLGSGCDAVAKRALQRAKFRPAKRVGGKTTDYEIDYEYVFSTR